MVKDYDKLKKEYDIQQNIIKIVKTNMNEMCDIYEDDTNDDLLNNLDKEFKKIINELSDLRDKCEDYESKLDKIRDCVKISNFSN
jgi:Skp family chaperone for outer membrane proteins